MRRKGNGLRIKAIAIKNKRDEDIRTKNKEIKI